MSDITVLSLGAGVQSTTLLLMAERGDIERPIEAIFADTGWEPPNVYRHLDWLQTQTSIPIVRVYGGDLRADALAGKPEAWMPLYTQGKDGKGGILRRQCTKNYKLVPIRRRVRALTKETGARHVNQQIGISLDEAVERMNPSGVQYITNVWPLVDKRMTRWDCMLWLTRNGYPIPGKSSCIGCTYRTDWREMKKDRPDEWRDAVDFDESIRANLTKKGERVFLHRALIPLAQVDLRNEEDKGQMSFLDECLGMCGV